MAINESTIKKFEDVLLWHDFYIGHDPERLLRGIHSEATQVPDGSVQIKADFVYLEPEDLEEARKRTRLRNLERFQRLQERLSR